MNVQLLTISLWLRLSLFILITIIAAPFELMFAQDESASPGKILSSPPEVRFLNGLLTRNAEVGTQLMISVNYTSRLEQETPYVVLIEVRGSDGTTRFIGWQTGTIAHSESRSVGMIWTPFRVEDNYKIRSFVISGFEEPIELFSPVSETAFETYRGDYFPARTIN